MLIEVPAINALPNPPPLHPADRALMRPPNALGKNSANASSASFLRRTEYTTSHTQGSMKFESSNSSNTMRVRKKRARGNIPEDDPIHITRHVIRGFNIAYPEDANTVNAVGSPDIEEGKGVAGRGHSSAITTPQSHTAMVPCLFIER
jgi:hypothetical protein